MASNKSVPLILGLGGVAAVFLTSGITGNSIGQIFKGDFSTTTPLGGGSAAATTTGVPSGIATPSLITAPSDAPAPIIGMVQWCNAVAGQFEYTWGGGHQTIGQPNAGACSSNGSGSCFGFDCSGAVSGALGAGGFLQSPLVSGELATWGSFGPGRYVTIWANSTHTFMRILGHWFGTGKLGNGGGVDWGNYDPDLAIYSVRHPPGY